MFPDELSDTRLCTKATKKVNLSTEVVKGVVPNGVSKWYMVRVVPKVVPKCGIEGGIEIHIPIHIIIHI